jgi:hypothetical protein
LFGNKKKGKIFIIYIKGNFLMVLCCVDDLAPVHAKMEKPGLRPKWPFFCTLQP